MKWTGSLVGSVGCVVWCYVETLVWVGTYFGWMFLANPLIDARAYDSVCPYPAADANHSNSTSSTSSSNSTPTPPASALSTSSSANTCRSAQLERHQLVFQVASGVVTASSLAFGFLLDRCGARTLKLVGTACSSLGFGLLAVPFLVDAAASPLRAALVTWALFMGLAALATSGSMVVLANYAAARVYRFLIITLLMGLSTFVRGFSCFSPTIQLHMMQMR